MEEKRNQSRVTNTTITRNIYDLSNMTDNVYETVAMLSNRFVKFILTSTYKKIEEFASTIDTMEEIFENREQIEVVRHFEMMPKPTLEATQEYLEGKLWYHNPAKDSLETQKLEAKESELMDEQSKK